MRGFQVEEILHPFIGYVAHPEEYRDAKAAGNDERSMEFGFPYNKEDFLAPATEDEVVVAILGGSVAYRFARDSLSGNKLRSALWVWQVYREVEQLGLLKSSWCLANYGLNALRKRVGVSR